MPTTAFPDCVVNGSAESSATNATASEGVSPVVDDPSERKMSEGDMPEPEVPIVQDASGMATSDQVALLRDFHDHRDGVQMVLVEHERRFYEHRDHIHQALAEQREAMRQSLSRQERVLGATISARLRPFGYAGSVAALVGVGGLVWLLMNASWTLQARLDREFDSDRIKAAIADAAEHVASEQLRPQVEEAKALVLRGKADTEAALAPLRKIQKILELQARAASLSRYAFDELEGVSTDASEDESVRSMAAATHRALRATYANWTWGDPGDLEIEDADGQRRRGNAISVSRLLTLLNRDVGTAEERAHAAVLLGHRHEKRAVAPLIDLIRPGGESELLALGDEVRALQEIVPEADTGGSSFDVDPILNWWDTHKSEFSSDTHTSTTRRTPSP